MKLKPWFSRLALVAAVVLGASSAWAKPFRVAVVMPSAINDYAWGQCMYDGLMTVQKEMGKENFSFVYSEGMFNVSDASAALRDYAVQGYDLVIAHGSQYGASLTDIAPDFPTTSFAWGSTANTFSDQGIKNIFAYEPRSEEGGYVEGVLAATLTGAKTFGAIGPIETGDAKRYIDGFGDGVKAVSPDATVNVTWTGSYGDISLAAEAAQSHINGGAKALTGTSQMTVGAIGVARKTGVYWFGYDVDQAPLAPKVVVSSNVVDFSNAIRDMVAKIKAGTYGGEIIRITLANGGLLCPINSEALTEEQVTALTALRDQTVQDIVSGAIKP